MFEELDDQEALLCLYLNQGDAALYDGDIQQAAEFLNRSLTYATGQGTFLEQCAKHKLGIVALYNGEPEKARVGYIGWIKFLHANYGFWNVAEGLWGLANLAIYWRQSRVAAQLLGAADHLRQLTPDLFPRSRHRAYADTIAAARDQLDETTYASAYAEGYAMAPDQAIVFALAHFAEP